MLRNLVSFTSCAVTNYWFENKVYCLFALFLSFQLFSNLELNGYINLKKFNKLSYKKINMNRIVVYLMILTMANCHIIKNKRATEPSKGML